MTKIISRMVPSDIAFLCSYGDFSHSTAFWKRSLNQLLLHGVPYRVFQAANGVLHFPFCLVSFALRLQLRVADHLADRLLYRTLDLLRRSFDTILVHGFLLCKSAAKRSILRVVCQPPLPFNNTAPQSQPLLIQISRGHSTCPGKPLCFGRKLGFCSGTLTLTFQSVG